MLTFIRTQLVTAEASPSAFADVCVESAPPTSASRSSGMIRADAGVADDLTRDRHRYVPGMIHSLGLPQSQIQSPYIHRASGLAQIAVSRPLRLNR